MIKARWRNRVIAQSDKTLLIDRKYYFPIEDVNMKYLEDSNFHTVCPWKGTASYYDVVVDGHINKDAVWYYPNPSQKARHVKGYLTFSYTHGIDVTEEVEEKQGNK